MKKKRIRKGTFAAVAIIFLLCAAFLILNSKLEMRKEKFNLYFQAAEKEKEWLMEMQLENGLFLFAPLENGSSQTTVPYFCCTAVGGLLTGDVSEQQAKAAEKYLSWHFEHLNSAEDDRQNGPYTIYDYKIVKDGDKISFYSKNKYDSADSYAAVFLIALGRYAEKIDSQLIADNSENVQGVIDLLLRCIGENGLSYAKKEYPVQFLMDNCEVYAGLKAAEKCLEIIEPQGEQILSVRKSAEKLKNAIENLMWNDKEQRYEIGLHKGEAVEFSGWEKFYPDSAAQLFPISFGLLERKDERSRLLYEKFCESIDWEKLEHMEHDKEFFWPMLSYTASLMGDAERFNEYYKNYQSALAEKGRNYPLHTGDSGWMAMGLWSMAEKYR